MQVKLTHDPLATDTYKVYFDRIPTLCCVMRNKRLLLGVERIEFCCSSRERLTLDVLDPSDLLIRMTQDVLAVGEALVGRVGVYFNIGPDAYQIIPGTSSAHPQGFKNGWAWPEWQSIESIEFLCDCRSRGLCRMTVVYLPRTPGSVDESAWKSGVFLEPTGNQLVQ